MPRPRPAATDFPTLGAAYRRLWSGWVRPHRGRIALSLIMMLAYAATSALLVQLTVHIVDAFDRQDQQAIALAPVLVLAVTAARGASLYLQKTLNIRSFAAVEADLQRTMYGALLQADLARMQEEPPAALGARFTADIGLVRVVLNQISNSLSSVATIVGAFTQMLLIDWQLTLGVLALFVAAGLPITHIGGRLQRLSRRTQQEIGAMTAKVNEGLSGARLAKTYRLEAYLQAAADRSFADLRRLRVKAMDAQARIEPMLEVVGGLALAGLIAFVGLRIAAGTNSIGDFSGFLAGLVLATQPLRKLGNSYAIITQGVAALQRIYDLLDQPNLVVDRPGATALPPVSGEIRFEGVEFRYPDGSLALRGIDLHVPAGRTVALVGRSGAGKSSLFNLIPRLYDVSAGRVTIDGHDVREVTLASLRDRIALVAQDSVLLTDTVAANIGFGRPGASRAEIVAAARAAAADGFIAALPNGYDTMLGEEGGSFSGGERQRIAIARAMLRDAPILLLDEPTSALDAANEAQIRAALRRLARGRTTIVIAHRLATILDADLICAMDEGRIVETGTHAELLARGGLYADLYRLQFREAG
jgi:subfamily B ATP-binding cassette protein MsbA